MLNLINIDYVKEIKKVFERINNLNDKLKICFDYEYWNSFAKIKMKKVYFLTKREKCQKFPFDFTIPIEFKHWIHYNLK